MREAKDPVRYTSCGGCMKEFPAKTNHESAELARLHILVCEKAQRTFNVLPKEFQ